ncbi:hypothetical protein ACFE04_030980 [Oxalis oulophora]
MQPQIQSRNAQACGPAALNEFGFFQWLSKKASVVACQAFYLQFYFLVPSNDSESSLNVETNLLQAESVIGALVKIVDHSAVFVYHLARTLVGDRLPLSLPLSSSTSKKTPLLFTLISELALLLVARGESETLIVRLRTGPDLTLYIDDAGIFVISGRKLLGIPELSGDEDLPDKLLRGDCLSSYFGGASFLIFITLSTICVPIRPGLTLSFAFENARFTAGTEPPAVRKLPFGIRPLEDEAEGSTEEDRELGAPGRPRVAESGLSGNVVLKFGGASFEKPGISDGFHVRGFGVGDVPREGAGDVPREGTEDVTREGAEDVTREGAEDRTGFLVEVETGLDTGADSLAGVTDVIGRRVGVGALEEVGLGAAGIEALLEVGVDDLALDKGVVDLEAGLVVEFMGFVKDNVDFVADNEGLGAEIVGLVEETVDLAEVKVDREVGVVDLEGLEVAGNVGRLVGVAGLDPRPPDDEGLCIPKLDEFNPGDEVACLGVKLLLTPGSGCEFANYNNDK